MSVQGQGAGAAPSHNHPMAAAAQRESSSPMIDGVNTLNNLEQVVALDQALVLTSIAVSLKRIADSQMMLVGAINNASYNLDRINNTLKELGQKAWTLTLR